MKAPLVPIETDEAIRSRRFIVQKNTLCLLDDGNQHKAGISKVSMKGR